MIKRTSGIGLGVLLAFAALAGAQTGSWAPLNNQPTFPAGNAFLLTDGTVMVQEMLPDTQGGYGTGNWWRLTPDSTGSYQNGTWSALASMPSGYAPLFYASAVLPDGRVVIEGGEYNYTSPIGHNTFLGAIYDPATNAWTSIAPPSGVTQIGDASSVVLPNGTFMLGPCCYQTTDYLLNASTLTWTATGSCGKSDGNTEEGWTLLPNGKVLTVDTGTMLNSEIYDPATGCWTSAGNTVVPLPAPPPGSYNEIGPAVLRPDGSVLATGATSNVAVYSAFGNWTGYSTFFPNGYDVTDGPAALLPNGNVLVGTSPGQNFQPPSQFYEVAGSSLITANNPPNAYREATYRTRMLVLPTGQILFTDQTSDVELYTETSGTYQSSWQPTINSFPATVTPGTMGYSLTGWQFNGLSQGAMYGDDAQAATNYPLVRITNNATGHVFYAKTHNHSTMGVATGSTPVSTQFDVPLAIESGPGTLRVVANGIPSNPVSINVGVSIAAHVGTAKSTKSDINLSPYDEYGTGSIHINISGATGAPVAGDWNGDSIDTVGQYQSSTSTFYLRNSNSTGSPDLTFTFGTPGAGWKPVAGDWNGDGVDTIGLYDPSTHTFYLRNSNSSGSADVTFTFTGASSTWLPIAGDWNGDGIDTVGLYDPATSTFYLRNSNTTGSADLTFVFGAAGAGLLPVAGDWNGDGTDTIGVFNPATSLFQLRDSNSAGSVDHQFYAPGPGTLPLAGDWDGH